MLWEARDACVRQPYPTRDNKSRNLIVARRNPDYAASGYFAQRKDAARETILRLLAVLVCLLLDRANLPWKLEGPKETGWNFWFTVFEYVIWRASVIHDRVKGQKQERKESRLPLVSMSISRFFRFLFRSSRLKRKNDRFLYWLDKCRSKWTFAHENWRPGVPGVYRYCRRFPKERKGWKSLCRWLSQKMNSIPLCRLPRSRGSEKVGFGVDSSRVDEQRWLFH